MRKILLVEDEDVLRDAYKFILSTEPYDIFVATNGSQALALCHEHTFDLILLDLTMPVMDGVKFLETFLREGLPATKVIIMSNLSTGDLLSRAIKLGAYKSVVKADMTPRQLVAFVRYEVDAP